MTSPADPPRVLAPELRMDSERWNRVCRLATEMCDRDEVPAVGLCAGRGDHSTGAHMFGRLRLEDDSPLRPDGIFLIASITKPVVAMAAMLLVERGQLTLGDRVEAHIPEFASPQKHGVTIRHLLTHTSGLPDMLPNNRQLRAAHAPLETFVEDTCGVTMSFAPGRGVQYQSMGFAVLGEIIKRAAGVTCAEFVRQELFEPIGMTDTRLGAPDDWFEGDLPVTNRIAEIRVPEDQVDADWNWNDRYWRGLGAPWGGLLSTPADLGKFARMMLGGGHFNGRQILSRATVEAATRNQLEFLKDVPEVDRRCRPWGLGWRLNWPAHSANFGDLTGPATFGHWGATGTVLWIDPVRNTWAVILTTQPQEPDGKFIARLSNAVAAAFL